MAHAPPSPAHASAGGPPDDLLCPLCHELFLSPLRTPCNHAFCGFCIRRFFEVRRPSDTGLLPPEQRQRSCPICRAPLQLGGLSADAGLDAHCTRAFPGLHRQRASETAQEQACLAARAVERVRLCVGNLHALRMPEAGSANAHDWTFFIRMESLGAAFIERVTIRMHPTFRPPVLTLHEPPFTVRHLGWGFFQIRADVNFRAEWGGETVRLDWLLDFEGQGSLQEVEVEVERRGGGGSGGSGGNVVGGGAGPATPAAPAVAAAVAAAPAGHEEGEEGEEEEEAEEAEDAMAGGGESDEEGDAAGSEEEGGGDYDLSRFLRWGAGSPASSSGSEGDPTYDPDEQADEDD